MKRLDVNRPDADREVTGNRDGANPTHNPSPSVLAALVAVTE
jgi:hypothetical protein